VVVAGELPAGSIEPPAKLRSPERRHNSLCVHRCYIASVLERVGIRELRNAVAAVVRRASSGERLLITVDGRPVAQLGPLEPDRAGVTLWDLAAAGLVEPPRRPDRPSAPDPLPVPADVRVDRLLEQVRGT
jgi:prevent-host-death family protein